jgi:hypothetical protein
MEALNNTESDNFFAGYYEFDAIKLFYLLFHVAITFIGPGLLYSVIWYENYGSDVHYRTVINILLSHICWINIFKCLIERIPYILMITMGPFPRPACDGITLFARYFFLCNFNEILLWQLMKYFYIFQWGRFALMDDDFIAAFVTLTNLLLCAIFIMVCYMIGFNNVEMDHHICTGKEPAVNIIETPFLLMSLEKTDNLYNELVKIDPLAALFAVIFVLLIVVVIRIWFYSKKITFQNILSKIRNINQTAQEMEAPGENIAGTAPEDKYNFLQKTKTNIIGVRGSLFLVLLTLLLLLPSFVSKSMGRNNIESTNYGAGRLWMYLSRVSLPLWFYCVLPFVVISGSSKMRESVRREIASFFASRCQSPPEIYQTNG